MVFILAVFCLVGVFGVFVLAPFDQYDSTYRGMDLYTASIRAENLIGYYEEIDWTVFFPDLLGVRDLFVQDNFFLVFLNSFGFILCVVTMFFVLASRDFLVKTRVVHFKAWRWVVVYYFISGLSGSFVNSFPNNQLFFIALGSFLVRPKNITVTTLTKVA